MYQRTAYQRWMQVIARVMPVMSDMRLDADLADKLLAHAKSHPKLIMLGDVLGDYVCMRCGADDYRPGQQTLSLKFGEMIVDVCLPDEVIDLIESALRIMVKQSLASIITKAGDERKAA